MRYFKPVAFGFVIIALIATMSLSGVRASAQGATPAADCATTTPEENSALVLRFLDASQTVDDDADTSDEAATIDQILADDVIYNVPGMTNAPGNADEIGFFLSNAAVFTDFSYTIKETIASDDLVAVHFTFHVSEQAIPGATAGATADADAVLIARIACGQIAEFTQVVDSLSLMQQLGVGAAPAAATPAS